MARYIAATTTLESSTEPTAPSQKHAEWGFILRVTDVGAGLSQVAVKTCLTDERMRTLTLLLAAVPLSWEHQMLAADWATGNQIAPLGQENPL